MGIFWLVRAVLRLLLLSIACTQARGSIPAAPGMSNAAKRLAAAHELYEAARFPEAAARFSKVLVPNPSKKLQASLEKGGLGPLQLTPYRREFARALVVVGDYSAATEQLQQMRRAISFLPSPALAGRFESDVLREEAQVYQCTGKLPDAAKALSRSIKLLQQAGTGPSAPRPADFFERYQRLGTLQNWLGRADKAADAVSRAIDARNEGAAILRRNRGAAARPMASFLPDVSGDDDAAWRSLSDDPAVARLAALLQAQTAVLREEALTLWKAGRFATQPECMHQTHPDSATSEHIAGGDEWTQLPVVGVDFMRAERGGCSEHTPAGCSLVESLVTRWSESKDDIPEVERVGYSSLAQGGWIRPHWGETNARLKLHLGLVIGGGPTGCAALTIDGESRAWSEGGKIELRTVAYVLLPINAEVLRLRCQCVFIDVLYFDDSFEHEALNNCTSIGSDTSNVSPSLPRIVLQVVIRHPRAPN